MSKPSKCKNCQYYGKPYWSIINPCDNCPNEETNVEIFTRWQDPTIEEKDKEIDRLNNIISELEKWLKEKQILYGINQQGFSWGVCGDALDKLQELKEKE